MESRNDRPVDWNLLSRYVAGSCSDREEVVVETWAAAEPENRRTLDELQQVWERVSRQQRSLPIDVDELWDELSEEMRKMEESSVREQERREDDRSSHTPRRASTRSRASRRRFVPGAISVIVIAVIAIAVFLFEGRQPRTEEMSEKKVFTTQRGQRATIRLTDGTQVRLNVESRLTVLPSFGTDARDVRLEGEAFFEVATDSTRPFTVHAQGADAQALGTAFDVNAYPGERVTRVMVTEGRVAMRPEESGRTQEKAEDVVLKKQEMGEIHQSGQRVVRRGVDPTAHLAWIDGKLVFEDAPFEEVRRKLERWYGIEISLREGLSPPEGSFNARFAEDQPLPEVLDLVSTVFGLKYQLKQKTVLFAPET
jgi:transmembrane sensor